MHGMHLYILDHPHHAQHLVPLAVPGGLHKGLDFIGPAALRQGVGHALKELEILARAVEKSLTHGLNPCFLRQSNPSLISITAAAATSSTPQKNANGSNTGKRMAQ